MKVSEPTPAGKTGTNNGPFFSKKEAGNFFGGARRDPFFKGAKPGETIQAKLKVGQPNDKYEQQADAMADKVVQGLSNREQSVKNPAIVNNEGSIQRKCANCEKEEVLQKKPETSSDGPSLNIESSLSSTKGSGSPLPDGTRQQMESGFGANFSDVRVHDNSSAAAMSNEINAQAFTHGKDIYFNQGKYDPVGTGGKHLLAHELTHVLQQNPETGQQDNAIQRTIGDAIDLSSPRFKGDVQLEACFDGEAVIRVGSRGDAVRKIQQALIDAGFPLPRFGADGSFGNETAAAVKEFQKQSGLSADQQDGAVGTITMSRLDSRFTGGSKTTVENTCDAGIKTITIDVAIMKNATGNPVSDIAFANQVFKDCCVQFKLGTQVTVPDTLSDSLLGGDTDLLMANCGAVSSEDLNTFLTVTSTFGLTNPIIAFYVDILHQGTSRLNGDSVAPICGTGPRAPMQGMIAVASGADARTFPHEVAHVLMNTFADHRVTADNLQHISNGATGQNVSPVQCAIMYTRAS